MDISLHYYGMIQVLRCQTFCQELTLLLGDFQFHQTCHKMTLEFTCDGWKNFDGCEKESIAIRSCKMSESTTGFI